jgi:hypothetical protein
MQTLNLGDAYVKPSNMCVRRGGEKTKKLNRTPKQN